MLACNPVQDVFPDKRAAKRAQLEQDQQQQFDPEVDQGEAPADEVMDGCEEQGGEGGEEEAVVEMEGVAEVSSSTPGGVQVGSDCTWVPPPGAFGEA
jgi:hypothetical protein